MIICRLVLLLIFIFTVSQLHAQDSAFIVNKRLITQTDGLPDRNLFCGVQDKYGFIWLGTRSGLCRYDGHHFIFFTTQNNGLRGTAILSLIPDDSTGIIIAYIRPGSSILPDTVLDVIDIKTLSVKPIDRYYPHLPFHESDIRNISTEAGRPVEFFTPSLSYNYTYTHKAGFQKKAIVGKGLFKGWNSAEHIDQEMAHKADSHLNRSIVLREDSTLIRFYLDNLSLHIPGKGYIIQYRLPWAASHDFLFLDYGGKLWPIDSAGRQAGEFKKRLVSRWCTIKFYSWYCIYPDSNLDAAVIEQADNSVVLYSAGTGFITLFRKEENIHVSSYFTDRQGAYWLCTSTGLYKVEIKRRIFECHFTRASPCFAFNNSARGIYADDSLFAVSLFDAPVIIYNKGDTQLLTGEQNFAIVKMDNNLWLSGWSLRKYDIKKRQIYFMHRIGMSEIWSMFPISDQKLLLGATAGLAIYNIATGELTRVAKNYEVQPRFIYKIFRNSSQELMAVAENGLFVLSENGDVIDCYNNSAPDKNRQLPCRSIYDVYEDKQGIYWIVSNLEGLYRWDREHHTFQQFGVTSGLLSTIIYTIQEDNYNNLWLGTDYGLARLNKETGVITNYTMEDGIADNEFNRSSSFKDQKGVLYFGGANGITSFNPADLANKKVLKTYPFVLLDFQSYDNRKGGLKDVTSAVIAGETVRMQESGNSCNLSYILLDYDSREHRYAYKVEDFDKDWIYTAEDHIRVSNLPPGRYKLRLKAQLPDGQWSEQQIVVNLQIIPAFYKTGWFIATSLICVVLVIILIFKIRLRLLKTKNEHLEKIVNEKTGELKVALNEQKAMLQEIHHRVKNNLQFIQAMIAMQINAAKNENDQRVLMDINRRINAMTLVHEMMYNRDHLESISIKMYITELVEKLQHLIDDQRHPIQFEMSIDNVNLDVNSCLALGMITTELLSNSIKHAFYQTDKPLITLHLVRKATVGKIVYSIKDNGTGFDENKKNEGLGMRLVDIFSRQLRGKYSIRNEGGCVFEFTFQSVAG
ncbi:histidine kinase dimerization/phosphoacceptor domain -containing protein [[Flexibacter] sp. ATCC 35208]|uniref:histidine kinase dimerization/phosphoacceptor domain -containing protein n=1 Tax=[Flexibacter] sp. ATCC 35208 TaxID=1936242 RepID=UPI0009CE34BD|nr:histidine kinase dimerization/phosphoacceptor domain -containing protein [[Flexibacter] sp. ATCC 35208]OMP79646.1 hypothetical protein BW716_08725 [[Flexibacter] sp. ATCC 35208]